jgi:membrane fusion protein (multidrug efflux system)
VGDVHEISQFVYACDRRLRLTAQEAVPVVNIIHPERGIIGEQGGASRDCPGLLRGPDLCPGQRLSDDVVQGYGVHVTAGDLLAIIETPDLDQELAQAQANLAVRPHPTSATAASAPR